MQLQRKPFSVHLSNDASVTDKRKFKSVQLFLSSVAAGKFLNSPQPQFSHPLNRYISSYWIK